MPSKNIKPTSSAAGAAALTGTPLTNEIEARKAAEKMRVNFILRLGLWSGCLFFKVLYMYANVLSTPPPHSVLNPLTK